MAAARTPSRSGSVHSSRSGGCVAAFLRVFDWNSSKGFSSSRRLLPGVWYCDSRSQIVASNSEIV